ncbi:MAG: hypothetical protein L0Z51_00995 [Candidatus Latescibacteria bacterium]|nr:hypothetical protein [Candidatus Latescibacterota bacterium]
MRRVVLLGVALLAATVDAAFARRVVVTRERLEAAAATRLSDAMVLLDAWAPSSNDGYTWMPTPRALTLPRSTAWSVVLNGQLLDVTVFDAVHLELVPVSIAEVDSIVFVDDVDRSSIGAAWASTSARIEIYAARATRGWTVGSTASVGNQTGDPGPYRYTDQATPNVDAIGADASLLLARGTRDWYLSLSGAMMQHPYTDPAMRDRTTGALTTLRPGASAPEASAPASWVSDPNWPAVLRLSTSARAGVRAGGGWHEGIAAVADARRYFHYSEPFGGEVPTDQRALLGSAAGSFGAGARTRIGYRALASREELTDQDEALAFDYDWTSRTRAGGIDLTHDRGRARAVLFAGLENRRVDTPDTLTEDEDTFVRGGARIEHGFGRAYRADLELTATSDGDDDALSAAARLHWVVRPADTVRVRAALQERLFTENDDLWLWSERGYDLLARQGVSYSIDGPIARTRVLSFDAGWSSSGVLGGVELNLGLRRFEDAYVETRAFSFDDSTCSFDAPTRVVTGQNGHVGVIEARLYHALGDHSGGDFSWAYVEEFDSDAAFGAMWQTVPRHRLRYTLWARPRPTWAFWARVCHYSPTLWNDYAGVDGASCDVGGVWVTYHSEVDGATFVDAMVQHGMWRQQLWVDVIARNVFDADVRYHPAGASFDLTLLVQARLLWRD